MENFVLTLPGDVKIAVPAKLTCITTYILLEQEDWFETEIKFLRHAIDPGMNVIDVGANFGVYTLSMAACTGPSGRVLAIEPAADTWPYLQNSVRINGFDHVSVMPCAASDQNGAGFLKHDKSAETYALANPGDGYGETVALRTLDSIVAENGGMRVDFIKMDAEGHEESVLGGMRDILMRDKPLMMLELISAEKGLNTDLLTLLEQLGARLFTLLPGINVLIPTDRATIEEDMPLNIFALLPGYNPQWDRVITDQPVVPDKNALDHDLSRMLHDYWQSLNWTLPLRSRWSDWLACCVGNPVKYDYARAMGWWLYAQDGRHKPAMRAGALLLAKQLMDVVLVQSPSLNQQITHTRICRDLGKRFLTHDSAMDCSEYWSRDIALDTTVPLLPLLEYQHDMQEFDPDLWFNMSVIEQVDRSRAISSFMRIENAQTLNNLLCQQRWYSMETERRLLLTNAFMAKTLFKPSMVSERLRTKSAESRNAAVWSGDMPVGF